MCWDKRMTWSSARAGWAGQGWIGESSIRLWGARTSSVAPSSAPGSSLHPPGPPHSRASLLFPSPSGEWPLGGTGNNHLRGPGPEAEAAGTVWSWDSAACGGGGWGLKLSHPLRRSSSWAEVFSVLEAVAVEGRDESSAWSHKPSLQLWPGSHLSFGHFLIGLTLLGALSPMSSSEISVRGSAWLGA